MAEVPKRPAMLAAAYAKMSRNALNVHISPISTPESDVPLCFYAKNIPVDPRDIPDVEYAEEAIAGFKRSDCPASPATPAVESISPRVTPRKSPRAKRSRPTDSSSFPEDLNAWFCKAPGSEPSLEGSSEQNVLTPQAPGKACLEIRRSEGQLRLFSPLSSRPTPHKLAELDDGGAMSNRSPKKAKGHSVRWLDEIEETQEW